MKVAYSFSTLRYVHDPVTQEFVNVGVAIFSPEARYFRAICTPSYSRVTRMFGKIDGQGFRQFSRHIQDRICAMGQAYSSASAPEGKLTMEGMLAKILPADDSALQFSSVGVGLSGDLDRTLNELYQRHVQRYSPASAARESGDGGRALGASG
jgi:DUF3037 family protein